MQTSIPAFGKKVESQSHTPIYLMHKYFARRPWNVFRELISHYSSPGDIILDPFCGGGVTVIESLKLRRNVVGVDINSLATYVTRMEATPVDLDLLKYAFTNLSQRVRDEINSFYTTSCAECGAKAVADWIEWDEKSKQIIRLKFECPICGLKAEKSPTKDDMDYAKSIDHDFHDMVVKGNLWYPITRIPSGDKTNSLLSDGINYFYELFTKRNLLALALIRKHIHDIEDELSRNFLNFTLSSSLKWSSRQSHLRGKIVEGWAMHAYWIYPKSLEINVWNTFERRYQAVVRGKKYANRQIGDCVDAKQFEEIHHSPLSFFIFTGDSSNLPIPSSSIDAVITDPPYGGNVNYAELSDYWVIWNSSGETTAKDEEAIINKTRRKTISDYQTTLYRVFKECYRILKPHRVLVSTFNSKDLRIVASFVTAASQAGFTLHPDGLLYQQPIRAYTTTFHAMQVGAFVGDFIFTFVKEKETTINANLSNDELSKYKIHLKELIDSSIKTDLTEPEVREKTYKTLIPFISKYANVALATCNEAVSFFETELSRYEDHFREIREETLKKRRAYYQGHHKHRNQLTLD
jgi:SAM-dependent methyltransferase